MLESSFYGDQPETHGRKSLYIYAGVTAQAHGVG